MLHGIMALAIGVMALAQTIVPPVALPVASIAFVPVVLEAAVPAPRQAEPISLARQMPADAPAPQQPPESVDRDAPKPRRTKKPTMEMPAAASLSAPQTAAVVATASTPASNIPAAVTTQPLFETAYLHNPPPDYPAAAKRRRQQGQVMLMVAVNASGAPTDVRVITSSGFELLDMAARDAVQRWQFVPAQQNGQAIAAEVRVPVMFRLE